MIRAFGDTTAAATAPATGADDLAVTMVLRGAVGAIAGAASAPKGREGIWGVAGFAAGAMVGQVGIVGILLAALYHKGGQ